jgi:hypothetical protein
MMSAILFSAVQRHCGCHCGIADWSPTDCADFASRQPPCKTRLAVFFVLTLAYCSRRDVSVNTIRVLLYPGRRSRTTRNGELGKRGMPKQLDMAARTPDGLDS